MVLIQFDEYCEIPTLCRALLRSCYGLFSEGPGGVVVIPILSGIPYVNIRGNLLKVSRKTTPVFISLAGMQETEVLQNSVYNEFNTQTHVKSLDRIMATFGGFPRLYTWLLDKIEDEKLANFGEVGSETAKKLYDGVKNRYSEIYPIQVWINAFAQKTELREDERISDKTIGRAREHLKRIHTIAVSGISVSQHSRIDRFIDPGMTYQELSAVGLCTLKQDPVHPSIAVINIPLILLDAYCDLTGICAPNTLSPFAYSWESMEYVAMWTLRSRWNSFYYTYKNEISVEQLRPGALHNSRPWLQKLDKLKVDKELPPVVSLASEFTGDLTTSFDTEGDARGPKFSVSDRTVFTLAPNEAGNDGAALLLPLAILNQTKSLALTTVKPNGKIAQGMVAQLVLKQRSAGAKFDFGIPQEHIINDLFTNRFAGPRLDASQLPDNKFLCTADNFATVVGPVFKDTLMLFKSTNYEI